jgi:hypothetical protein
MSVVKETKKFVEKPKKASYLLVLLQKNMLPIHHYIPEVRSSKEK